VVADVKLRNGEQSSGGWQRNFYATSSCGVCGKASIDAVKVSAGAVPDGPAIDRGVLQVLPDTLRQAQRVFDRTGGLHAAGLFTPKGGLEVLREDVGRHNAVDKVVGRSSLDGRLPLRDRVLLVSGRVSFEIVQNALVAGIPFLAAVSAPSTLAVRLAREANMTVVGFLRPGGFNVYCGPERIASLYAPRFSTMLAPEGLFAVSSTAGAWEWGSRLTRFRTAHARARAWSSRRAGPGGCPT
jgi:FdhD protein